MSLREPGWVSRRSESAEGAIRETAFGLPAPVAGESTYDATSLEEGDRAIVIVRGTRLPEVGEDAVAEARERQRRGMVAGEFSAWVGALRNDANIERNEDALTR